MTKVLLINIVFILISTSIFAKKLKILVNSPNAWFSHAQFQGKIADVLVEAGHEVHFLLPEWNVESHHNFTQKAHQIIRFSTQGPTQYKEIEFQKNPFDSNRAFDVSFVSKIVNVSDQFCIEMSQHDSWLLNQLNAENYDVGISEAVDPCMFGIFEKIGIRTKLISSAMNLVEGVAELYGIPMPRSYVPIIGSSPLSMNYLDRAYNLYYDYKQEKIPHSFISTLDKILKTSFGQNFPDLLDILRKTSFYFANMPEFLDIPRPMSSKLVHVGGIAMPKAKPLTTEIAKIFEKSKKGVVVFSFGSIANTDLLPEHIRMAYLEAFLDFPEYEFIWKYHLRENDISLFGKFPNVHPVEWLEQNSLLAHPKTKAFMTHCGLNSLIESSFNGVPLIATPLFGDQNYNTFIIKQKETGVYINFKEISVQLIKDALKQVLYMDK